MKLGFKAETAGYSSAIGKKLRFAVSASMIVLALAVAPLAVAQTQSPPPAAGGSSLPTAADATNIITQAVGGNAQTATQIIQALGGDPVTALNAFTNGNASSSLAGALGGSNAVNMLTQAMGSGNALSALTGALGQNGSINALVGALGGNNAIGSLAGSLLGNSGAVSAIQSALGGNAQGLQALSSFLGGNTGALGALTSALGGTNGALSALTGALGANGALSALSGALGANGALSALTNALGVNGALNALTGALGGQISQLLGGLGLSTVCGIAPLTGTFAVPACTQTAQNRSIEYAQEEPGGKEVAKKIEETHTDRLLPAMKDRTAQLSAGVSDQSRQQGSIADGAQVGDAQRDIEREELNTRQGLQQHEQSCALPTSGPALAQTHRAGIALQRAMVNDFTKRNNPIPGSTAARGYAAVVAERYENYCRHFVDPEDNNGVNACTLAMQQTEATAGATPPTGTPPTGTPAATEEEPAVAAAPNGDIDAEGILLTDTIDMNNPAIVASTEALLDNLVQSRPYPPIPPEILDSAAGVEWTAKKERLETLRKLAADTVAGMIARRTGIPLPDSVSTGSAMNPMDTGGGGSGQCQVPNEAGDNNAYAMRFAQQEMRSGARYISSSGTTLCQRFSWRASNKYLLQGGNVGSAIAAKEHFERNRVLQRWNPSAARPGDIVYLTSVTPNGRRYGHTGIYGGNNMIYHVWRGARINHTGLEGWYTPTRGRILGFVRPSGASAAVADCQLPANEGVTPGQPREVATGPTTGLTPDGRTGAPASTTPPDRSPPDVNASAPAPTGTTERGNMSAFLTAIRQTESGGAGCTFNVNNYRGRGPGPVCMNAIGCMGYYQFCPHNLQGKGCVTGVRRGRDTGPLGREFIIGGRWQTCTLFGRQFNFSSTSQFMEGMPGATNQEIQERAMQQNMKSNWAQVSGDRAAMNNMCRVQQGIQITPSGFLAAAHLGGTNANKFMRTGQDTCERHARGRPIGTPGCVSYYFKRHGGYTISEGIAQAGDPRRNCPGDMLAVFGRGADPSGDAASYDGYSSAYSPPPPRPVREVIREIRQRAGIPDSDIAEDPSYNEIMLAMTKERFFDPRFFAEITDNVPAMQHNETALNAYMAMTLQDIELLQEQINALVAARASLRLEELDRKSGER